MQDLSGPCGMTRPDAFMCVKGICKDKASVLFPLYIIECSKFLNSSAVMKKPCSVASSRILFELEQHPEGTRLKPAPAGTLIAILVSPGGFRSER